MRLCLLLLLSSLGAQAQPFFNTFVDSLLKEKPILDTTVIPGIGADDYALARLFENRRRDAVIADFLKQGQLGVFPYASTKDDLINQLQCDFNHQYTYSFSMGGDSFYTQGNGYYLHDLFTHHHHKSFRVVIFKKYAFVHMQNDEGWVRHYFSIGYSNGFDSSRSFQFPLDTTIQLRYANLFREEAMLEMRKLLVEINYRDSSLTVDSNGRYQLLFYYHKLALPSQHALKIYVVDNFCLSFLFVIIHMFFSILYH